MDVILIESITPENIGFIARCMKNFNLKKLILINPRCNHLSENSLRTSSHAKDILKKTKIEKDFKKLTKKYDCLIGTTGIRCSDYNLTRTQTSLDKLSEIKFPKKTAIIFGREDHGLSNEQLKECDYILTIPTSNKYPILNISHAASILFYELNKHKNPIDTKIAPKKEREALQKLIEKTLNKLHFTSQAKKNVQKNVWKKVLSKSMLTKREIQALFGFFKKI